MVVTQRRFARPKFLAGLALGLLVVCSARASYAQGIEEWDARHQPIAEAACTAQRVPGTGERTYKFRTVKWPLPRPQAYGIKGKRWFEKILGKVIPGFGEPDFAQYSRPDVRFIKGEYGRPVPLGETERSKKIRAAAEKRLTKLRFDGEQEWQKWLAEHPNATALEREKARFLIFAKTSEADKLDSFDWRTAGLDLRTVGDQGFGCNVCWAFSTIDAMQITRQLYALRSNQPKTNSPSQLEPSVPRLITCMSPNMKPKDSCTINWHGEAFSYMVDNGLPLGNGSWYDGDEYKEWTCDKTLSIKALTWDFVSSTPNKVATREGIKQALITYGPLVTTLNLDECLLLYGGGIFDEQINIDGPYHMILIVGWDDEKGAWLVKNSFGTEWGEQGFGWVKYESNNIGKWAAWIMPDPKVEDRLVNSKK